MTISRRTVCSTLAAFAVAALLAAAPASAATPRDARTFVDSIGVNTHLYYTDTAYSDFAMTKLRLQEMGIRHVRDGFDPSRRQFFYDRVNSLGQAGIKSTLITCQLKEGGGWINLDNFVEDAKAEVRSSLDALEGVNEPDLFGPDWVESTRGCQYWLNRLAKNEHRGLPPIDVPILGPSVSRKESPAALGDIGDRTDVANFHPYQGGQKPGGPSHYPLATQKSNTLLNEFPGRTPPIQATETGYHDAVNSTSGHRPVSQRAAAIYMPRLYLEHARQGVQRSFIYELVDERADPGRANHESNFGLFENDWSYKPSATALKNTIGFLDSPSASAQQPLGYTLSNTADPDGSGTAGAVKDMLMQKADGSWWLVLWQDSTVWDTEAKQDISNPAIRVGVKLDRTLNATGYRPTKGTGTYGSVTASSFLAGVTDDVLLIRLR